MAPRILFLKSFPGHRGRPGEVGGSIARAAADGRPGGTTLIPIVDVPAGIIGGADYRAWRKAAEAHARERFTSGRDGHGNVLPLLVSNRHGGGDVLLGIGGVEKGVSHNSTPPVPREHDRDHFAMVPALPELLANAVPSGTLEPPREGNDPRVLGYERWHAAARHHGRLYRVRLTIRRHKDGQRFYDHRLSHFAHLNDAPDAPPSLAEGESANPRGAAPGAFIHIDLLKAIFNGHDGFDALLKAASIPPGARWITVRPNGPGTEGNPVLVQPTGDGAMRVIGGAGGKLTYLKLHGVKSEAEYAESARARAAAKRQKDAERRRLDRESGAFQSKQAAREVIRAQVGDREAQFIQATASAFGWKDEDTRFPEERFANAAHAQRAARPHGSSGGPGAWLQPMTAPPVSEGITAPYVGRRLGSTGGGSASLRPSHAMTSGGIAAEPSHQRSTADRVRLTAAASQGRDTPACVSAARKSAGVMSVVRVHRLSARKHRRPP